MTDNEIIKALECCSETKTSDCKECPLLSVECSKYDLYKLALDLINHQKAENEENSLKIETQANTIKILETALENQNTVNVELQLKIKNCISEKDDLNIELQAMRGAANSYKAEIERLKAEIRNTDNILNSLDRPLFEVKAEAIKEFAERLKEKIPRGESWLPIHDTCLDIVIDTLVKEMAGETDGK